jgi:hypothetical protein
MLKVRSKREIISSPTAKRSDIPTLLPAAELLVLVAETPALVTVIEDDNVGVGVVDTNVWTIMNRCYYADVIQLTMA